jgi:hypothetical protein
LVNVGSDLASTFVAILFSVSEPYRGAFWQLLAALQIQLNRSPSSTPALL